MRRARRTGRESARLVMFHYVSSTPVSPPRIAASSKLRVKTAPNHAFPRASEAGLRIALLSCVIPFERRPRVTPAVRAHRNLVNPSDELFFLLEGQTVQSRGNTWRIQVCGVYSTEVDRWIQLSLSGSLARGVTLRSGFRDAGEVLDLVRDWLDDSLPSDLEPCIVSQADSDESPWIYYSDTGHWPTLSTN